MRLSPRRVPFVQFQREVRALLVRGRVLSERRAASWLRRWDKYVRLQWRKGRPPCVVADHLFRYENEKVVRARRDADRPEPGEIYENKRGDLWEVVGSSDTRVDVRRAGHRAGGSQLRWSKSALRNLKEVKKKELRAEAEAIAEAVAASEAPRVRVAADPNRGKKKMNRKKMSVSSHKRMLFAMYPGSRVGIHIYPSKGVFEVIYMTGGKGKTLGVYRSKKTAQQVIHVLALRKQFEGRKLDDMHGLIRSDIPGHRWTEKALKKRRTRR
jgi:hypothetical protein